MPRQIPLQEDPNPGERDPHRVRTGSRRNPIWWVLVALLLLVPIALCARRDPEVVAEQLEDIRVDTVPGRIPEGTGINASAGVSGFTPGVGATDTADRVVLDTVGVRQPVSP